MIENKEIEEIKNNIHRAYHSPMDVLGLIYEYIYNRVIFNGFSLKCLILYIKLKLDVSFRPFFYKQICNVATLQDTFAPIYRGVNCNTETCCMQRVTLQ